MFIGLKNFGRHRELTIEWGTPILTVVGSNRAGKTTVRDALEFALLGTCELRGFALKKDVGGYMIREGADRAQVEVSVPSASPAEQGFAVRRMVVRSGAQRIWIDRLGNGGWVEVSQNEWAEFFPHDPRVVRVLLDGSAFWHTSPEERRRILVGLRDDAKLSRDVILDALDPKLLASATAGRKTLLDSLCSIAIQSGFKAADAFAVEKRRELKRALDALPAPEDPASIPVEVGGLDIRTLDLGEADRALASDRAELAKLREQAAVSIAVLQDRKAAAESRREAASKAWDETGRAFMEEFTAEPGEGEPGAVTLAPDDLETERRVAEELVRVLRDRVAESNRLISGKRSAVGDLENEADPWVPEEWPKACPAVGFEMRCPVKAAAFERAHAEAKEAAAAAAADRERERESILAEIEQDAIAGEELRHHLRVAEEALAKAAARCKLRSEMERQLFDRKNAFDLAHAEVLRLEHQIDTAPRGLSEEDLAAIQAKIDVRAEQIAARRRLNAQLDAENARARDSARLLAEIEWVDAVEKEMRPSGVEGRLASAQSQGLADYLRDGAEFLGSVEIAEDFTVEIGGAHIASASKSEQLCAGVCLQYAVARRIGLPLIVVDELDALDQGWRTRFAAFAEQIAIRDTSPVKVIGLATSNANPPSAPPRRWTTAWLDTGPLGVEMIQEGAE